MADLSAPYPYFGGKARVAPDVWARFGADVPNYIEPFCGSCATVLHRPGYNYEQESPPRETVNDIDAYLVNFWRAMQADPDALALICESPVCELDLIAWNNWLVKKRDVLVEKCKSDPYFFNPVIAGRWVWGLCQWVGAGWCEQEVGIKLPKSLRNGVNCFGKANPYACSDWFALLAKRFRYVRITCGEWERVLGPPCEFKKGMSAIFLDPPYISRDCEVYTNDSLDVAHKVREWALTNGDNPHLRIALCGYEGEHPMPDSWEEYTWEAMGGYGNQGKDNEEKINVNRFRERIWFSPHCIKPQQIAQARGSFGFLSGSRKRFDAAAKMDGR